MPDSDRYHTDVIGDQRAERRRAMQKREAAIEKRRQDHERREESRFRRMDDEARAAEEHAQYLRDNPNKGRANQSSVPYDPVSMRYDDSLDGQRLKHKDQRARYAAKLRTNRLQAQTNRNGYNPITGEDVPNPANPARPETPQVLRSSRGKPKRSSNRRS